MNIMQFNKLSNTMGAWGIVWVKSIVVCLVSVVLSKYESNLIINKEVMEIFEKCNTLTLTVKVIQRSKSNSTCKVQYPHNS